MPIAPEIGVAPVEGCPAVHWLLVLIEMNELLVAQALEAGTNRKDGEVVCDHQDAFAREVSRDGIQPKCDTFANVRYALALGEAVEVPLVHVVEQSLLWMQGVEYPPVAEQVG